VVDAALLDRYGAEALDVMSLEREHPTARGVADPEGFPHLEAQLRHAIRTGMVMKLEDFYLRRAPLFAARADHGLPWADRLARIWAEERELSQADADAEALRLREEIARRSAWLQAGGSDQKK